MRTAIEQREELAIDVEHDDVAAMGWGQNLKLRIYARLVRTDAQISAA